MYIFHHAYKPPPNGATLHPLARVKARARSYRREPKRTAPRTPPKGGKIAPHSEGRGKGTQTPTHTPKPRENARESLTGAKEEPTPEGLRTPTEHRTHRRGQNRPIQPPNAPKGTNTHHPHKPPPERPPQPHRGNHSEGVGGSYSTQ